MGAAGVTIVVATWNRPDALRAAVRSALRQTVTDWRMLVIGDGCDPRTGAVLAEFDDRRIAYVNLTARFGEQAGPNSIGMALADSPLIALLNHDDVWLPDHLERARTALDGPADLYIGLAARADESRPTPDGVLPVFARPDPARPKLGHAFYDPKLAFEPCSTWVFRTELARRVGPWRPARELHRTPADDWLLRAWRQGARVHLDREVTVLQLVTHYRHVRADGCYAAPSVEHDALTALLERTPTPRFRRRLAGSAPAPRRSLLGHALRRPLWAVFVNPLTCVVYRWTGFDAYGLYCRIARKPRGRVLQRAARKRTGRELPPPPDRDAMLSEARRVLAGSAS